MAACPSTAHRFTVNSSDQHPGALESQWIPTDPELWTLENYRDFLQARRELLAHDANTAMQELRAGLAPIVESDSRPAFSQKTPVHVEDEGGGSSSCTHWMRG